MPCLIAQQLTSMLLRMIGIRTRKMIHIMKLLAKKGTGT